MFHNVSQRYANVLMATTQGGKDYTGERIEHQITLWGAKLHFRFCQNMTDQTSHLKFGCSKDEQVHRVSTMYKCWTCKAVLSVDSSQCLWWHPFGLVHFTVSAIVCYKSSIKVWASWCPSVADVCCFSTVGQDTCISGTPIVIFPMVRLRLAIACGKFIDIWKFAS